MYFRDSIRSAEWEKYRVHLEFPLCYENNREDLFLLLFFFFIAKRSYLYDVGNSQRPLA